MGVRELMMMLMMLMIMTMTMMVMMMGVGELISIRDLCMAKIKLRALGTVSVRCARHCNVQLLTRARSVNLPQQPASSFSVLENHNIHTTYYSDWHHRHNCHNKLQLQKCGKKCGCRPHGS
jgi:hypothetical protein